MENVLVDQTSGSFNFHKRAAGGCRNPRGSYSSYPYSFIWSTIDPAPPPPYARPPVRSYASLPLLPSNQPPLLPLPPLTKHATLPYPCPPPSRGAPRPRDRRKKPPAPPRVEPPKAVQRRRKLERAAPLPPALVVAEALDDLEQEAARRFVQDLLHALAPPPSSLPLPRFSLVAKSSARVPPAAASCNTEALDGAADAEAATTDGIRRLLRL